MWSSRFSTIVLGVAGAARPDRVVVGGIDRSI
jgi:hypothetical protein